MASTGLRREEGIGLAVAVVLHAAVLAALLVRPPHRAVVIPPQRIEVTISDEAALTSTSPDPFKAAAPDSGPEVGEPAPEPEVVPAPPPPPLPVAAPPRTIEAPKPRATAVPAPRVVPRPAPPRPVERPKPVAKAAPAAPPPRRSSAIDSIVAKPSRAAPATRPATAPPKMAGSSSFADAFREGVPGARAPEGAGKPAAAVGQAERVSLAQAVLRQVKPVWQGRVPEGVNADRIVTVLSIELNRDGSLARKPAVVSQSGIDDSNRTQAARHAEEAIRAVQLAAPFRLPPELYEGWKKLPPLRFRKSMP